MSDFNFRFSTLNPIVKGSKIIQYLIRERAKCYRKREPFYPFSFLTTTHISQRSNPKGPEDDDDDDCQNKNKNNWAGEMLQVRDTLERKRMNNCFC